MHVRNLNFSDLNTLLISSFGITGMERGLAILVDLPASERQDSRLWRDRRRIAAEWYSELEAHLDELSFELITLCSYENVGVNNGNLPNLMTVERCVSATGTGLLQGWISTEELLSTNSVVLAMTEYSATAPLKLLAQNFKFRGATLPGFSREMIPALGLDYSKVDARVRSLARILDRSDAASIVFEARKEIYRMLVDLRHRNAHVSGGLITEPGAVANLPSGEAYIVPYEGEIKGDSSRTAGVMPVQFGDELVLFKVTENRAREVLSSGTASETYAAKLAQEPAFGNIAELGIGVLGEWGISPIGSTLLDEKLGPHIAFGRSDHFGGHTGAAQFTDRSRLVHIDWVYVREIQPDVVIRSVTLSAEGNDEREVVRDGKLVL